jgi:hypothetical protein
MASPDLIRDAAEEYRVIRRPDREVKTDRIVDAAFAESRRLDFVIEKLWDMTRCIIATHVALGCEDEDSTHECLGELVRNLKMLATAWNAYRSSKKAGGEL